MCLISFLSSNQCLLTKQESCRHWRSVNKFNSVVQILFFSVMSEYLFRCEISLKLNANLILPAVVIINEAGGGGRGKQPVWACANLVPRFFSPLSPRWKTLETRLDWGDRVILYYLWRYELHSLYRVRQQKEQKGYCFFLVLFVCLFSTSWIILTVCFKFCIDGSLVSILGNLQNVWLLWKAVEILLFRSEVIQMLYQWSGIVKVVRISKRLRMRVSTTPQHWSRTMVFPSMQYTWGCPLWHCYDTR